MAIHIRRREFIGRLGSMVAAWPLAARAQPTGRIRRVGALMALSAEDPETKPRIKIFEQALRELGWADASQFRIDYRWTGGDPSLIQSYAADLVAGAPDVILANATPTLAAVHKLTRTIPIVFVQVIDPVTSGFVRSLAKPGGNVTGFTNFEFPMGGKWIDMLKVAAPLTASVAVIFNPDTAPYGNSFYRQIKESASLRAIEAVAAEVHNAIELDDAVATLAKKPAGGVIVLPDTFTTVHRDEIIALSQRHHLPGIYPFRYFATRGGLISYGVDASELFRRSASYVDRILRGENPANLPVQAPTKYELVINLKTASTLGLDVPLHLQQLADEIIE